jgi:acyl-CoA thioester hydrolase
VTESSASHPTQAVSVQIQLRFGDMDALGHVNNVAVLRVFEEARVRLISGQLRIEGVSVLVARQEVEYRAVLEYTGADARVHVWTSRTGGSSFELSYALENHNGQTTAVGATTVVVIGEDGRPAPIPAEARARLEKVSGPPIAFRGR